MKLWDSTDFKTAALNAPWRVGDWVRQDCTSGYLRVGKCVFSLHHMFTQKRLIPISNVEPGRSCSCRSQSRDNKHSSFEHTQSPGRATAEIIKHDLIMSFSANDNGNGNDHLHRLRWLTDASWSTRSDSHPLPHWKLTNERALYIQAAMVIMRECRRDTDKA